MLFIKTKIRLMVIAFLIILSGLILLNFNKNSLELTSVKNPSCLQEREKIYEELNQIFLQLKHYTEDNMPSHPELLRKFEEVLKVINSGDNNFKNEKPKLLPDSTILDVCPEEWFSVRDKRVDHPFFQKGFITYNCSNVRPLSEVVSLAITFRDSSECRRHLSYILRGLNASYSTISLYIPSIYVNCKGFDVKNYINVIPVPVEIFWKPGKIWNTLVKSVQTRYVIVGRNLNYFDNFSQIERQIRMISYTTDIRIAGGSQRNMTGHWQIGCYQTQIRNYILEYKEGYYMSRNECMFCDHLLGSFVAKKDLLLTIPFDEFLPESVLFEDFFLKVKSAGISVVNCPDVMYFSTNHYERKRFEDRQIWLPLIRKWELNKIFLPGNVQHSYNCQEVGISCLQSVGKAKWFLLPICCLEQFGKAVEFLHQFCSSNNISYEFESGSVLSALKMKGLSPWDHDGDLTFYNDNYTFFVKSIKIFRDHGFVLDGFESPPKKGKPGYGFFYFKSPEINIDMYSHNAMSKDLYLPPRFKHRPTKMMMHHTWVYTQVSPGLYCRNRYGHGMLKHSIWWWYLRMHDSWAPYDKAGSFLKCKQPSHHACMDHFSGDGNLQFYMP